MKKLNKLYLNSINFDRHLSKLQKNRSINQLYLVDLNLEQFEKIKNYHLKCNEINVISSIVETFDFSCWEANIFILNGKNSNVSAIENLPLIKLSLVIKNIVFNHNFRLTIQKNNIIYYLSINNCTFNKFLINVNLNSVYIYDSRFTDFNKLKTKTLLVSNCHFSSFKGLPSEIESFTIEGKTPKKFFPFPKCTRYYEYQGKNYDLKLVLFISGFSNIKNKAHLNYLCWKKGKLLYKLNTNKSNLIEPTLKWAIENGIL